MKPRKLNIGFDFHNVTVKSNRMKSKLAFQLFNKIIPSEIFRRKFVTNPALDWLTEDQYHQIEDKMYSDDLTIAAMLEPVKESNIYIKKMLDTGHNLCCITSCGENGFNIAQEYFKIRDLQEVECLSSAEHESKAPLAKEKNLDAFMDDDLHKLIPLVGIVPNLFILSWAYNKHKKVDPNLIEKVSLWERFYERIGEISLE